MYGLVVRFDLKDQQSAIAFDRLVAETAMGIQANEPGTLVYATHHVNGEPLARVFYEIYRDLNAFDEHERQPHTMRFLQERENYIKTTRVEFMTLVTAKGLPQNEW